MRDNLGTRTLHLEKLAVKWGFSLHLALGLNKYYSDETKIRKRLQIMLVLMKLPFSI